MLTHDNANFPSDVFTIMSAVNASVTVGMLAYAQWLLYTDPWCV